MSDANEVDTTVATTQADESAQAQPATEIVNPIPKDPEEAEMELKMCKDILNMPEEVQARFKALKVINDKLQAIEEAENAAHHTIECKYE